jgi:hypothetical protein
MVLLDLWWHLISWHSITSSIPKSNQVYSSKDLIFGQQKLDYKSICQIPFGAYAQVHDDPDITNTMESQTTLAISLGTTGNIQGTHKFLSLKIGDVIVRQKWTELPMPSDVIEQLNDLTLDKADSTRWDDEKDEAPEEVEKPRF